MAGWVAILPKRPVISADPMRRKLESEMGQFILDAREVCATYEVPPTETYDRKFRLRDSWSTKGPDWKGRDLVGIVRSDSNTAPYNKYVRGPKGTQAASMKRRGWKSIDQILAKMWPPQKRRFMAILKGRA